MSSDNIDEPVVYGYGPDAPTPEQAEEMRQAWREAHDMEATR